MRRYRVIRLLGENKYMNEQILSLLKQLRADTRIASFDEAATKQIVLLRVISLLGWDIYNIEEVKPEFAIGNQRVDYSLRHASANKVFIEVKKVGEDLERHQEQLLNYSFKEGVKLAILTNGISWRFYLPLHEGSWEQRKFYTIELYDQEPEDIAERFICYLEKENVLSDKAVESAEEIYNSKQKENVIGNTLPIAWNKLLSEPDELLIEIIADATEKLCGYKPDNSMVEDFISSNIIKGGGIEGKSVVKVNVRRTAHISGESYIGKSVTAFTLRNVRYEVRYWIDVLTKVTQLMYNLHTSNFNEVLQLRGRKRPYYTKNANELRNPQRIEGSDIFMETNLSSRSIVGICRNMITLFGYSEKELTIETH